ncbi:uncharacterized protein N7511_010778 [Penicillium nucicola]|uniref:uncharacterized protein n=1 Tax=Penicillium nucicola TaxID=1850975 RepID=UPI002545B3D3|nr:uncharacterized protein N7511_010778 [Penicillium nucicola]KAJ5749082.1 hypothetical protein N7511_010778 [Penicillium nucicola]
MSADEAGEAAAISATNGDSRDITTIATPGKRKRSTQDDPSSSAPRDRANLHETLSNLTRLLLKHDSELKLLSCPFPASTAKPRTKRAKVSGDQDTSNIQTRVNSDRYSTLQEFLHDIERASAAVIERNQGQTNGTRDDGAPLTEVVNQIAAFKKHMNSLVGQTFVNQAEIKTEAMEDDDDSSTDLHAINFCTREDKHALTLFGNPAHPRQLFSSLQKSMKVPLQSESGPEKFVEVQEELRDTALPNGITTTKVAPFNLAAASLPKRTFGEVFAPRPTLPQLEPPRKRSHRSSSVSWIDRFDATFDSKSFLGERSNYCLAPLPSTQWVQYGGITSSPAYWDRVEKQHTDSDIVHKSGDPALWSGIDSSALQGVFSSFAPSFDSSNSIVQQDSKNMVWWGQRGANRLSTLLCIPFGGESKQDGTTAQPGNIGDLDESSLEEMVKSFNPDDFAQDITQLDVKTADDPESREIKEMLGDISGLLDTLSSYQRIRNLDQPASFPNHQESETNGTPAPDSTDENTPSDAEYSVYETLKSSLVAIISTLPPYAVAKLDGHKLSELNISQKILIDTPDYNGTMEKDDFTLSQERAAALMAATSAANRNSTPSSQRPPNYQGSQPSYSQRAFASNARLSQSQPGFQGAPQQVRQPSAPSTYTQAYGVGRPPSTPSQQRPGHPSQYSQPSQGQYQRPAPNGYYSAQQGQPSQGTLQPYTTRPSQPGFNATPQGRTPYTPAGSAQPQRVQYPNQTPSQGGFAANSAAAAAAATHARSAAEQAALMDRNKAQLAAQQTRHSPSTPQPLGLESQEGSATPGSRQNGTPA